MKNVSLFTDTIELANEICDEIRLFVPVRKIEYVDERKDEGYFLRHEFHEQDFSHRCSLYVDGALVSVREVSVPKPDAKDILLYKKLKKRGAKKAAFYCLNDFFKMELPWGSLTGIRPTKLYRELKRDMRDDALQFMKEEFDVSENKLQLLHEINAIQEPIIGSVSRDDLDIYIGIPFCTSRCAYCSFASALTSKTGDVEEKYVDALLYEIEKLRDITKQYNIRSVYIGGGTPTSLRQEQFERVLRAAGVLAKEAREFTVEAGRPDTITKEKLQLIKDYGANRISVNAQTSNDNTLKLIGRSHSYSDFLAAFALAKQTGLLINTDLIIGLPGETQEDALKSVRDMISLRPENITVHTLAIKNASKFAKDNERGFMSAISAQTVVNASREVLKEYGYSPYYMYRQKYMAGNLENVGYSLPKQEGIYNIDIMEETTSILAFGAGGMSKRVYDLGNRIERTPAVKDITHYITRTQEMAQRKLELFHKSNK